MSTIQPYNRIPGTRLAEWINRADFAVLPIASVEWHGPHLPFGTDQILTETLATTLEGDHTAVLFPTMTYSFCPGKTSGYRGTVSIRPDVALAYLCDVLDGILGMGFERVLILNAHDANMSLARTAMEWVTGRHQGSLLLINWWQMVEQSELEQVFGELGGRGHGGPYESSAVWAFAPDAVAPEAAPDLPPRPNLETRLPHVRVESQPEPWRGYGGWVSRASRDKGEALAARVRTNLARVIGLWLAGPQPGQPVHQAGGDGRDGGG